MFEKLPHYSVAQYNSLKLLQGMNAWATNALAYLSEPLVSMKSEAELE
jgi:hypothetical protein